MEISARNGKYGRVSRKRALYGIVNGKNVYNTCVKYGYISMCHIG